MCADMPARVVIWMPAGSGCWEGEYGWCLGEVIHGHMHMPVLQVLAKGTTSPAWKEHKALSGSIPQGNVE